MYHAITYFVGYKILCCLYTNIFSLTMAKHLHGFYIFKKPIMQQKIAFSISDIILCDVSLSIPYDYYHLTDLNDQICTIDYVEIKNLNIVRKGKAYIAYKTDGPGKIFSLVKTLDSNGTFLSIDGQRYKIFCNPYKNYYTKVYFDGKQFVYEKTDNGNTLVCEELEPFDLVDYYGTKENVQDLIKHYINENKQIYLQKTLTFLYSAKNTDKMHGFCVYKICQDTLFCYVLLSEKHKNVFFFWNVCLQNYEDKQNIVNKLSLLDFDITNYVEIFDKSKIYTKSYRIAENHKVEENLLLKALQTQKDKSGVRDTGINNPDFYCENLVDFKTAEYDLNKQLNSIKITEHVFKSKIPEKNNFAEAFSRPLEFYIQALTNILLEKKVVFLSINTELIFEFIRLCLELIKPFEWTYFLFSPLPDKLLSLLDSPFPFICGVQGKYSRIKRYVKTNKIVVFDLDKNEIKNNRKKINLPLYMNLQSLIDESNSILSFSAYIRSLTNNIDIAREISLQSDLKQIEKLINDPKLISARIYEPYKKFFCNFFETRMFVNYVNNVDSVDQKYGVTYVNNTAALNINACYSTDFSKKDVYELFFNLVYLKTEGNQNPYKIEDLVSYTYFDIKDFNLIFQHYLKIYSIEKEYAKIAELIEYAETYGFYPLSSDYKYINQYISRIDMSFYEFFDLSDYSFEIQSENHENQIETAKKNKKLQIYVHKLNVLVGRYNLIHTRDITTLLKFLEIKNLHKENLMKVQPEIFWNIILRFELFQLPINILPTVDHQNIDTIISSAEINSECKPKMNKLD